MDSHHFNAAAAELRNNPVFADFTIACDGTEYRVHKAFVSCHSVFFRKLFRQDEFKEMTEGRIDLKEDSPKAVELMVNYFYGSDYSDRHESNAGFSSILELNVAVYVVAEKYEVPDLKILATKKFAMAARSSVSKKENPLGAIILAFNETPTTDALLRPMLLQYWTIYGSTCLKWDPELSSKIVLDAPEFANEILTQAATNELLFVPHCTGHYVDTKVSSVSELWTVKCHVCGKLVGEHKGLTMTSSALEEQAFWGKWLK